MGTVFLPIHVALEQARREMDRNVKFEAYDERQIGKTRIATLYFSVFRKDTGREYRANVYRDGKLIQGMSLS
jgi:hypothetical protein